MEVQTAAGQLAERFSHKVGLQAVLFGNVTGQATKRQHVIADLNHAMAVLQV